LLIVPPRSPSEGTPPAVLSSLTRTGTGQIDIGDTRLRAGSGWDAGDPVSTNDVYERAIDVILDEVEAEHPDSVLVAGDLVEGRWGRDVDGTGIFGPVRTLTEKRRAVLNAAGPLLRRVAAALREPWAHRVPGGR